MIRPMSATCREVAGSRLAGLVPIVLTAVLFLPAAGRAADGVAGKWDVVVTYGDQNVEYSLELEQEGETVRGGLISPRSGRHAIRDGAFKGGILTLGIPRQYEGQDVVVRIEARLQGNSLEGTVALGDFGSGGFRATRQSAGPSPAGSWQVTTETRDGRQFESRMVIEEKGGKLEGKMVSQLGAIDLRSVSAEGKKFRFGIILPIEGNDVEFLVEAEFSDRDRLKGRWRAAADENVNGSWEARREAPAVALTGVYVAEATTPGGEVIRYRLEIEEKEGAVRGTLTLPDGSRYEIREGRYGNGELSFRIDAEVDGQSRRARCTARPEGRGGLRGRWETDNDSGVWSARRMREF